MASANTPDPGQPISILDIKRVFGAGLNQTPGEDLNDYHGVAYWNTTYPFAAGKFNTTLGTQLTLQDFYSKTATDPATAGSILYTSSGSSNFTVPVFRNSIQIEVWGAGGGGGAGHHDYTPPAGASGGLSSITVSKTNGVFQANTYGGGGGGSGYRYGNQNGSGGGGGTYITSGVSTGCTVTAINGNSGAGGDAGNGRGGAGGSAPNGGAGGSSAANSQRGGNGNAPGGGAGSGGDSDFQSGKNANPNRSAGGGGGSGSYVSITIPRSLITPGSLIAYTIGAGGAGSQPSGAQGSGGNGGNGGVKFTWS